MSVTTNKKRQGRPRRPLLLLALVAGLLLLSLYGWLRFQQSLALWEVLKALEITPGPLYLAVGGAVWGAAGLAAAIGVYFWQPWGPVFARGTVLALGLWYWLDRLVLVRSEAARESLPFTALVSVLVVLFTFAVLRRTAPLWEARKTASEEAAGEADQARSAG